MCGRSCHLGNMAADKSALTQPNHQGRHDKAWQRIQHLLPVILQPVREQVMKPPNHTLQGTPQLYSVHWRSYSHMNSIHWRLNFLVETMENPFTFAFERVPSQSLTTEFYVSPFLVLQVNLKQLTDLWKCAVPSNLVSIQLKRVLFGIYPRRARNRFKDFMVHKSTQTKKIIILQSFH